MGGFGVKVQHFPLTLLVVLTTLTLPCERDYSVDALFKVIIISASIQCLLLFLIQTSIVTENHVGNG